MRRRRGEFGTQTGHVVKAVEDGDSGLLVVWDARLADGKVQQGVSCAAGCWNGREVTRPRRMWRRPIMGDVVGKRSENWEGKKKKRNPHNRDLHPLWRGSQSHW